MRAFNRFLASAASGALAFGCAFPPVQDFSCMAAASPLSDITTAENYRDTYDSYGDVDLDGFINLNDVDYLLEEYSNLQANIIETTSFTSEQSKNADVNHDGAINALDASLIYDYYVNVAAGFTEESSKRLFQQEGTKAVISADNGYTKSEIKKSEYKPQLSISFNEISGFDRYSSDYSNTSVFEVCINDESKSKIANGFGLHLYYPSDAEPNLDSIESGSFSNVVVKNDEKNNCLFITGAGKEENISELCRIEFKARRDHHFDKDLTFRLEYVENDVYSNSGNDEKGRLMQAYAMTSLPVSNYITIEPQVTTTDIPRIEYLGESPLNIYVGERQELSIYTNGSGYNFTCTSSDPDVAEVDSYGYVTGKSSGTATISIINNYGSHNTIYVTVNVSEATSTGLSATVTTKPTTITTTRTTAVRTTTAEPKTTTEVMSSLPVLYYDGKKYVNLYIGNTENIGYYVHSYGHPVYSSSDTSVATVDENGVIEAISPGTAMITISEDFETAEVMVYVEEFAATSTPQPTTATQTVTTTTMPYYGFEYLDSRDIVLYEGTDTHYQLKYYVGDPNGTIKFTSSAPYIVSVDEKGYLTVNSPGNATIVIESYAGGHSYKENIRVTIDGIATTSAEQTTTTTTTTQTATYTETSAQTTTTMPYYGFEYLGSYDISMNVGDTYQLMYEIAHPESGSVKFRSTKNHVVSVDEKGLLTANSADDARVIIEEYHGGGYYSTYYIKVHVSEPPKPTEQASNNIVIAVHDGNGKNIAAANFVLSGIDSEGNEIVFSLKNVSLGSGAKILSNSGEKELVWITGNTNALIKNLPDGTYILHEITAPVGYNTADDVLFTIRDGVCSCGDIVEIENKSGENLPQTGTTPFDLVVSGALSVTTIGILMTLKSGIFKRDKNEDDDDEK